MIDPDVDSAVLTIINVIHENIPEPIMAQKAAREIMTLATGKNCDFIGSLSRLIRASAADDIAERLLERGCLAAAAVARTYADEQQED